ncbi:MAG: CpaF family protein [Deltaproteobacteria bacterium]|nr:CpaF family protein [Deltaproteobacteria bacterium]MBI3295538.1 CpaF family protein [Deltaproteobacteria bacterium]
MIDLKQQFAGRAQPLFPHYTDPDVTDILINGTKSLYIEKDGALTPIPSPFESPSDLFDFIERLLLPIGRRIDAARPYLDGRLPDGGRFNILLPPLAVDGPCISIRKPRPSAAISLDHFGDRRAIHWLHSAIQCRTNILIGGGTGSGKTTLVGRLLDRIEATERLVLIEESSEIQTTHPHSIRLETRPLTPEGVGAVSARELLRNALRMRPDRLVLGECRGEEAFDLIQALNTGHSGSLGTIHANSCLDALRRVEALVLLTGFSLNPLVVRQWVASAIGAVVHLEKCGAQRSIRQVIELSGLEGDHYRFCPLFESSVRSPHPLYSDGLNVL